MANEPKFATIGTPTDKIDVRLSYRIVELFSEGLYASPNKAIEELVANSFDAGAKNVQVILSPSLHDQDASIVVIDDGEGMGVEGLKQHWLIGVSNKRRLGTLPRGRQQIGQFGIGKLATYVLSERLTHISKRGGQYYSTSMDYSAIDRRVGKEVEPKVPITLALHVLTEADAKEAISAWTGTSAFKASGAILFGKGSPASWTVAIMSSLKTKVHEIKPGVLEWVLRTALPLRDDFAIWFNGKKLAASKQAKGRIGKWILGKDITELSRPAPSETVATPDNNLPLSNERHFGLNVPELGRVTGYAEAYKDLLAGKSDEIGRSYGFFVYIFGRLINVDDGHFGIDPNELRHGKVAASTVDIAAVIRHRKAEECHHALVVGRSFPATETSALSQDIDDDRAKTIALGEPKTITLITIDDLAELVRLRPLKQIGLVKLRELFQCRLPAETHEWIEKIRASTVKRPPYKKIVDTISEQQKRFKKNAVKFAGDLPRFYQPAITEVSRFRFVGEYISPPS